MHDPATPIQQLGTVSVEADRRWRHEILLYRRNHVASPDGCYRWHQRRYKLSRRRAALQRHDYSVRDVCRITGDDGDGCNARTLRLGNRRHGCWHAPAGRYRPGQEYGLPPGGYVAWGSKLIFGAYNPAVGAEPWEIDAGTPNADDDTASTSFNTAVHVQVLANDGDLSGKLDPSSVAITSGPASGAAAVDSASGEIIYTPNQGFSGMDVLQYTVKNQAGNVSNVANVFVLVGAPAGQGAGSAPE